MKHRIALTALVAGLGLTACGTSAVDVPEIRGESPYEPAALSAASQSDAVVDATMELGLHLLSDGAIEENVVVSPASISLALALLAEGADGDTAEALDAVLGASGDERTAAFSALQAAVAEFDGDPAIVRDEDLPDRPLLHLANGITIDEQVEVEQAYLEALTSAFDAGVITADLRGGDKAVLDAWVAEHTGGLIEESAIEPTEDTVFVLQNAVVLAAQWRMPFDEADTSNRAFTSADGVERTVPTMRLTRTMAYVEQDGTQAVRLPYTEGFAMDVVLPAEGTAPDALTANDWEAVSEGLAGEGVDHVRLSLPKIDTAYDTSLNEALRELGLGVLFDEVGDLDGIAQDAVIADAAHQAVLTVDEEGTVAAAVTEIHGEAASAEIEPVVVEMTVDRPFALRIVHVETGWPLFLGVINSPEA